MDAQQRTDAWFQARLGKCTASRFGDATSFLRGGAESAYRKNYRSDLVVERLTGQKDWTFTSSAMQWGIDNEPIAKDAYMSETGNEVTDAPFVEHPLLAAGASPDGYVGQDGLVEIKCPNTATHIETLMKRRVPFQYLAQVQGQMWITGRKWCDFVSFDPRLPVNAQLFILRVERDDDYITSLEDGITDFLEEVDKEAAFVQSYK